jgi:isopropylmalate/homocitrate/citramalate synthase
MAPRVRAAGRRATGVVAAAFGCPFEGRVPATRVFDIVERLVAAGADEIVLADTIGSGLPSEVGPLVAGTLARAGGRRVGAHFHNTRNMGYANAWVALGAGATLLDSALGGLGGCPFAPRATGNIATEDLVAMLRGMDAAGGVDLARLIEAVGWLETTLGQTVPGLLAKAGPFPDIVPAHSAQG